MFFCQSTLRESWESLQEVLEEYLRKREAIVRFVSLLALVFFDPFTV